MKSHTIKTVGSQATTETCGCRDQRRVHFGKVYCEWAHVYRLKNVCAGADICKVALWEQWAETREWSFRWTGL